MVKFRIHAIIEAADRNTAMNDLRAMSVAHTNKTVIPLWIEQMEGG